MTNPFEGEGRYLALRNDEGQHSPWPVGIAVPAGWSVVHGPDERQVCLDVIARGGRTCGRRA